MSDNPAPVAFRHEALQGMVLISLAVLCFAVLDSVSNKYLAQHYAVSSLIWARYTVHMLIMLGVFGPRMKLGLLKTARPGLQILRAICLLGASLFLVSGLLYLPLAEPTAINYVTPLLVIALSVPLLGDKVDWRDWLAYAGLFGCAYHCPSR
jgi:drug/metabolite transporter (DMT)-like permease